MNKDIWLLNIYIILVKKLEIRYIYVLNLIILLRLLNIKMDLKYIYKRKNAMINKYAQIIYTK